MSSCDLDRFTRERSRLGAECCAKKGVTARNL